jgi:eukaryotic-like serine/threonine-protein kinase
MQAMNGQTRTLPMAADQWFGPTEENDLSGTTLGGCRLTRKIAQGGMGVIYEAVQIKLARRVAVKILAGPLAARPEFRRRFEHEARAAATLNHPNIIQVHDYGEAAGRHYLVMEFVEGGNLSEYVAKHGKMTVGQALAIVEQTALALRAAAERSIIHRDIKPSNLMLDAHGRVKVADLGLARILTDNSETLFSDINIGSPHFIAPEQAGFPESTDCRADMYSLGITLLYLLTGKYAYDGDSPLAIVRAHASQPLPSGADLGTDLPPAMETLIRRMAAKKPDERYPGYDALLADLNLAKQGLPPPPSRRISGQARAMGVVSVMATALVVMAALMTQMASNNHPRRHFHPHPPVAVQQGDRVIP